MLLVFCVWLVVLCGGHEHDRKRFDVEQQKTNVEHAKEGADGGTEKRASGGAGRKRTLSESISKTLVPTVLPSDVGGTNGERSSSIEDLKQRLQVRACVVPHWFTAWMRF